MIHDTASALLARLRAEAVHAVHDPLTQHFVAKMKAGAWPFVGNLFDGGAAFDALPIKAATPEAVSRALLHAAVLIGGGPLLDEEGRVMTVRAKRPSYGSEGVTFGDAQVTVPLVLAPHRFREWGRAFHWLGEAVIRCEMALAADPEARKPGASLIFDQGRAGAFTPSRAHDPSSMPGPRYSPEVRAAARLPGDPEQVGAPEVAPAPQAWGFADGAEDAEDAALDAEQQAIREAAGLPPDDAGWAAVPEAPPAGAVDDDDTPEDRERRAAIEARILAGIGGVR